MTRLAAMAIVAVGMGAAVVRGEGLVALVAPATLAVLLLIALVRWLVRWPDDPPATHRLLKWTIASFFAHLALGLLLTNVKGLATYFGGDAFTYHKLAVQIVRHWTLGEHVRSIRGGAEGFYYLLAGSYLVFGFHMAVGLVLNAALGAALIPLLGDLTYRLFGRSAARYAARLALLMPGLFLWTSQLLKEAPILFLIALAAYVASRLLERTSLPGLVLLAATAATLFSFRGYVGLAVAAALIVGAIVGKGRLIGGLGLGLSMLSLMMLVIVTVGLGRSGYQAVENNSNLKYANNVRTDSAQSANSGFGSEVDISSPQRAIYYLPVGMFNFVVGPLPWQLGGVRQLPALPDAAVWWVLLPSLWRGLREGVRVLGRRVSVLALPALAVCLEMALIVGNFGALLRERCQVIVLVIPFIALGLATRAGRSDPAEALATAPAE